MAFSKIQIQQFRGIKDCTIDNLAKHVNLFVGRNNCGKTSVLDAIFLLFSTSAPRISVDINNFRDYLHTNFNETAIVNFYNLDSENKIQIIGDVLNATESKRDITIKPLYYNNNEVKFDNQNNVYIQLGDKQITGLEFESRFTIMNKVSIFKSKIVEKETENNDFLSAKGELPDEYKEKTKSNYITSKSPFNLEKEVLENVIENKKKDLIIDSLKNIDVRINDISIVRNRVMIDVGLSKLMPIEVLGDGIRKVLKIILFLYESRDGILLIDEIDNGLHFSSMPILWSAIIETAKLFNVQVFATTHNIDSLKALKSVLETSDYTSEQENTACYRLRHADNDELVAFRYDFEKFGFAIDMEHEIR